MKLTTTDLDFMFNISMHKMDVVNRDSLVIKMLKAVDDLNFSMVAKFYDDIEYGNRLVIDHPIIPDLETYACHSYLSGMVNYVMFTCKDYNLENTWILCQVVSTVSAIIVNGNLYYGKNKGEASICNKFVSNYKQYLLDENIELTKERNNCLLLSNNRPYHFIYDSLYTYYYLNLHIKAKEERCSIHSNEPFFDVCDTINYKPDDSNIYVKINGISRNLLVDSARDKGVNYWDDQSTLEFEKWLFEKYKPLKLKKNKSTHIWIGVIGQKRAWHQQISGYANIINTLAKSFDELTIYVDGWTSPAGLAQTNNDDLLVYNEIKKLINNKKISLVCLIGADYKTKIETCCNVDYHISVAGSGSFVPERICHTPGVVHGNNTLNTFNFENSKSSVFISGESIIETPAYVNNRIEKHGMYISYHANWEHIYNKLASVIFLDKGVELDNLVEPSLTNLSTNYALNCLYIPQNKKLLEAVFSRVNNSVEETPLADILKETALACEQVGDYVTAKHIMRIAKALRPSGALISQRDEYYSAIHE